MEIEFDSAKSKKNILERGIGFGLANEMDWESAWIRPDTRKNYGEDRFRVVGFIKERLHVLVFTPRGNVMRIISLRKANKKEEKLYEEEKG